MGDFEKRNNVYKQVMTVIITAFITFVVTATGLYNYYVKSGKGISKAISNNDIEISESTADLNTKIEVLKTYIQDNYLWEIDEEKLENSALKGYVNGLGDEYTEYLTKGEVESLMIGISGNYVGIGIYMAKDKNNDVVVLMPIPDSPAEEEGIKTGDIITKVNGEECNEMDLDVVASKVKGEEGTTVEIEILRDNDTFTKTITRREIVIKDMESKMLDGKIGYIQILSFDTGGAEEFKQKLEELKNQDMKSLIIDVRDNGGGVVDEVIEIADILTKKDSILMITEDRDKKQEVEKGKQDSSVEGLNIVILANENSASASEILVAALKDNEVAKVVGATTYGKGVMQEVVPISSIGGALKVTIKEFKRPNGNQINKTGIEPDIEVEDIEDTENNEVDEQLNKAIEILK